jgi:putative ABC transport system ATP-binding protein
MLRFESVTKLYKTRRSKVTGLDQVNVHIRKGEFVALVGPSGSGKTTFLVTAGAMLHPTSGKVYLEGRDVFAMSPNELAELRLRSIGFIFQTFNLIPYLSARQNVMAALMLAGKSPAEQEATADRLLEKVGLADRADHKPSELSVGQQQRVALARMLANDPPLILADEPTGNLDPKTSADVMDFLTALNKEQGKTIVMVTHSMEAAKRAKRVITCTNGSIQAAEG